MVELSPSRQRDLNNQYIQAAFDGDLKAVKALLSGNAEGHKADPRALYETEDRVPLRYASALDAVIDGALAQPKEARGNHLAVIKYLREEQGFDIDGLNVPVDRRNSLSAAVIFQLTNKIDFLVGLGAAPFKHAGQESAFLQALWTNPTQAVRFVQDAQPETLEETHALNAALYNRPAVLHAILDKKPELIHASTPNGSRLIHSSLQGSYYQNEDGQLQTINLIIERDPACLDLRYKGKLPLHMAAHNDNSSVTESVVRGDGGRNINAQTEDGKLNTAAHIAAELNNSANANLGILIEAHADLTILNAANETVANVAERVFDGCPTASRILEKTGLMPKRNPVVVGAGGKTATLQ